MDKITAKHYIEYTKDGITDKFHEGDKVKCRTADREYTGTIACVGEFKENEEAEPVTVICLDTSKSIWSHSSEIIKFDDIDFMCKDFLTDTDINSDISDEEIKKIKGNNYKVIEGYLTYIPSYCPNCGCVNETANDIIKWDFRKNCKIKIPKISNCLSMLLLYKQRFLCKHCKNTFIAETSLVARDRNI